MLNCLLVALAYEGSGEYSFFIKEHLGSVRLILQQDGTVKEKYWYSPYGEVISATINGNDPAEMKYTRQKAGQAGHEEENEGLANYYYAKARYYNSVVGIWNSTDPLGQYPSPYSYVGGNPVLMVDPSGMGGEPYAPHYVPELSELGDETGELGGSSGGTRNSYLYGNILYQIDGMPVDYWTYANYAGYAGPMIDDVKITGNPGISGGYWEEVPWQKSRDITHPVWGEGIEVTAGSNWRWIGPNYNTESYLLGAASSSVGGMKETYIPVKEARKLKLLYQTTRKVKFDNMVRPLLSLRELKWASVFKYCGTRLSVAGLSFTFYGIVSGQYQGNYGTALAGLDLISGGIAFTPGIGWLISANMQIGKVLFPIHVKNINDMLNRGYHPIYCFIENTEILTGDGYWKPIQFIQNGDTIATVDIKTLKVDKEIVKIVVCGEAANLVEIIFSNGQKNINTSNHPYYVKNKGWCAFNPDINYAQIIGHIEKLEVGDICISYDDGEFREVKILEINLINENYKVYTISDLEKNHNFIANGILVHNKR